MKRIVFLIFTLTLLFSISACGSERAVQTEGMASSTGSATFVSEPTDEPTPETPAVAYEITYSNFKLYKNSIGTTWGQTIVEFENTGTEDLYLSPGSFDIENAEGTLVASKTSISEYPSVLKPGERGYLYSETFFDDLDVDGNYTLIPRIKAEKANVDCIRFDITDFTLKEKTYGDLVATGRITNTSDEDESWNYVVAILKNGNGEPIGVIEHIITETIAPGDKIGFEMTSWALPDDITIDSVADYVLFAYPYQLQF